MTPTIPIDISIKIRPLAEEDFDYVLQWSKDEAFCLANEWELNRSEQELYRWWMHCINHLPEDFIRMGIESDQRLIGYADLAFIQNHSAELGIAIGESTLWGKSIGYYSSISMMNYASAQLGITQFRAETHEANGRARRMLERLGFKEVSRVGTERYLGTESKLIQFESN